MDVCDAVPEYVKVSCRMAAELEASGMRFDYQTMSFTTEGQAIPHPGFAPSDMPPSLPSRIKLTGGRKLRTTADVLNGTLGPMPEHIPLALDRKESVGATAFANLNISTDRRNKENYA